MIKIKKNKLLKSVIFVLLFIFSIIYFSEITGYYEFQNHEKAVMTSEQIKKFENDVVNGKEIDLQQYLVVSNYEYDNNLSKLASKMSDGISYLVKIGVDRTFRFLSKMVEE